MQNGMLRRRPRRQLSPAEKWELFLEVTSGCGACETGE